MIKIDCQVLPDYIIVNSCQIPYYKNVDFHVKDLKIPKNNLRFVRQNSSLNRIEFHTNENTNNKVFYVVDPTNTFLAKLKNYRLLGKLKERVDRVDRVNENLD